MSAINVGEVKMIEMPATDDIWNAATLKSRFPIAYTDAFAAGLAQEV